MASIYIVEIGLALRNNTLLEDYMKNKAQSYGKIKFENFAKDFAFIFKNSFIDQN